MKTPQFKKTTTKKTAQRAVKKPKKTVLVGELVDHDSESLSEDSRDTTQELTGNPDDDVVLEEGDAGYSYDEVRAPKDSTLLPAIASDEVEETLPDRSSATSANSLLKQYMDEVSRYQLLTPEEEFNLAVQLKEKGDLTAAKTLVRANLRLVVKIAMEYHNAYQNLLDLIQEGNVGLMKAVSKFDPNKGAKLSYYASWWIRSYILKYILDNFRLVRVGTTQAQKKLFFHLMKEKAKLEAQGIHVTPKLIADKLHVKEEEVVEMSTRLGSLGAEMSLNAPIGSDGESQTSHMDFLEDEDPQQDVQVASEQLKEILKAHLPDFVKTLKEKERAIFEERLAAEDPKTLQEVADKFGLTRERARQIEVKVIEKLRDFYKTYIN